MPNSSQKSFGVWGVLVNGVFWYFDRAMSAADVSARQAQRKLQKAVQWFWIGIAGFSLIIFALGILLTPVRSIFSPSLFFLALSVAVFASMLVFYQMMSSRTEHRALPNGPADLPTAIPSLEVVSKRDDINRVLAPEAAEAIDEAFTIALAGKHAEIIPLHLFLGTLSQPSVRLLSMRLGVSFADMQEAVQRRLSTQSVGTPQFSSETHEVIAQAFSDSVNNRETLVSAVNLFLGAYKKDPFIEELYFSFGAEREDVENVVAWLRISQSLTERYERFRHAAMFKPTGSMNRAYTAVETKFLNAVSEDLTRLGVRGGLPMLIGRTNEVDELLRLIEGGRQSVVLVGPSGVGKSAIVAGVAERMIEERVPTILKDKRLVKLSIPHLVSASGGIGAQEKLLYALQEVGAAGNVVLVIEGIDQLYQTSSGDLSPMLANELEKGYTFVIATVTPEAHRGLMEGTLLGTRLTPIRIDEPSRNDAIRVLESKINGVENKSRVVFTYEAVAALVELSDRYLHETYLPEKAIQLAEEVAIIVAKRGEWTRVTRADVEQLISGKARVPIMDVGEAEGEKLLSLEEEMHRRMIGQEEAVAAVASALRRARAELRAENRPIANFLFLGPTGVGKTELAKTTAEVYFGSEDAMLRFDMSEYQDQASVARLIGGAGETGLLTEAVRRNPSALVLLDELEKAHPDILNLFLQVMDDGRLTDGQGRTIDFTNVILIATSNAGTQFILDETAAGVDLETMKQQLMESELRTVYRPEFLNRFDGVMVFKPLSPEDVIAIAYLQMKKVTDRLLEKGIHFRAEDEAVHELAKLGYDPKFGARPLRRVVQERVENAIADFLLRGTVGRRDTLVLEAGGNIRVEKAEML